MGTRNVAPRKARVAVRISESEEAVVREAAKAKGYSSPSAFIPRRHPKRDRWSWRVDGFRAALGGRHGPNEAGSRWGCSRAAGRTSAPRCLDQDGAYLHPGATPRCSNPGGRASPRAIRPADQERRTIHVWGWSDRHSRTGERCRGTEMRSRKSASDHRSPRCATKE